MTDLLIRNARIVDGTSSEPSDPVDLRIVDGKIAENGTQLAQGSANVIDLRGAVVMPGLIDCHVHVIATTTNLGANADLPNSLVAARAGRIMEGMLMRGFTTVRDLAGADHGLVVALEEGTLIGPRLVICGKALSQTGGHTDYRGRYNTRDVSHYKNQLGALGRIADGVSEVRRVAREELMSGAQFIKIMANGGVSSPSDPVAWLGYSREELLAAVEEAQKAQTYVAAHLYTDQAVRIALECGVRSIEHGNLMRPDTIELAREKNAVVVPTNITYDLLAREGASWGLPPESVAKIEDVREAGLQCLEALHKSGVTMGFGTDLLGEMHPHQSEEFILRGQRLPAQSVIRSATVDAAKVLQMEGQIGTLAPGAYADLIVVDGNPLEDLGLLTGQGQHMPLIMQAGRIIKNTLS
ncbi:MAG: amidohydrolase family protein [Halomonas sp.]|nr:amidohydrolase family protein [Halomonas sp.]TVP43525.1 MAG: amidohydrolase family protein [Halomonas sp.]